jgi:hypothetical protein
LVFDLAAAPKLRCGPAPKEDDGRAGILSPSLDLGKSEDGLLEKSLRLVQLRV